jgi:hypothetical protein
MASTRRTLIVLIVSLSVVMAACTGSDGSGAVDDSVTVPETLTTTALQPVTTSTVYDFESISIDDFYSWAENQSEWNVFLGEAEANCETTVMSLSAIAEILTIELDSTIAAATSGMSGELPVANMVETMEKYETAVEVGAASAETLSGRLSIENAHAYTMLVTVALNDLHREVTGLRSTAVDLGTDTIRIDSIAKRVPRVEEAGEAVAELVYRPPEWECPHLRP